MSRFPKTFGVVLGLILGVSLIGGATTTLDELEQRVVVLEEIHGITTTTTTTTIPTTTTTVPGSTAIAGIGCSNTEQAVRGYRDASSQDQLIEAAAGGWPIRAWARKIGSWDQTDYFVNRPADGYTGAWINLCERASYGLHVGEVEEIIAEVRNLEGDVPIWLSPLNFYVEENCDLTNGNQIPNEGVTVADELAAADPMVHRAPDLGPLADSQLRNDDCHLNDAGEALVGSQLVDFFD